MTSALPQDKCVCLHAPRRIDLARNSPERRGGRRQVGSAESYPIRGVKRWLESKLKVPALVQGDLLIAERSGFRHSAGGHSIRVDLKAKLPVL